MSSLVYYLPVFGLLALVYMAYLSSWVSKQDAGDEKMTTIAKYIAEGAMAFLKAEYRILAIFVLVAGAALAGLSVATGGTSHWFIVVAFVIGAVFSATA